MDADFYAGRIIEIIAQPVGPQKLAKVLHRCMQRTKLLEQPSEAQSSNHVSRSLHQGSAVQSNGFHDQSDSKRASNRDLPLPIQTRHSEPSSPVIETTSSQNTTQPATPVSDNPTSPLRPGLNPHQGKTSQSHADPSLPAVLVVDDNHINLQLMVTFVRKARNPFASATDGVQAVEAYKRAASHNVRPSATLDDSAVKDSQAAATTEIVKPFKYILMDINMPHMDGIAATKEIRKYEKENGLERATIFALTGLGQGDHPWAEEAGFDRLLSKPIKFKELKGLLS
jgi:CheY-like chemotaxis protein